MAVGRLGVVHLQAGEPQVHRQRAEKHGHAGQRGTVLAPGDPGANPATTGIGRRPASCSWRAGVISAVIALPPTVRQIQAAQAGRGPGRAAMRRRARAGRPG